MPGVDVTPDYKTETAAYKSGDQPQGTPPAAKRSSGDGAPRVPAKAEAGATEEFLRLLARALQYVHTYPSTSPLSVEALSACHTALHAIQDSERLLFVVEPRELRAGDVKIGAGTVIEQELARRLHAARVSTIEIDRSASLRELSRFCEDATAHRAGDDPPLAEVLAEHGVDGIVLTMAHRPEVLHIGAPPAARARLMADERQRRERASIADGPSMHLYPPDTGWIRMDPGVDLGLISLPDLAILADKPTTLAAMLSRLSEPDAAVTTPAQALASKFSEVAKIINGLEPRLATVMFSKLAGAVLELDGDERRNLLQKTVLPGLLEGWPDGKMLRELPDVDLADALALLLDVETAAPELLPSAFSRLDLPPDRREIVATLLEDQVRTRQSGSPDGRSASALDERIRELIRIGGTEGRSFEEYAAVDLSIDEAAAAVIAGVGPAILQTDPLVTRLECAVRLIQLEPNPDLAEPLLRSVVQILAQLEEAGRWDSVTRTLLRLANLSKDLREPRPDVAGAIAATLSEYFDAARIDHLIAMYEAGGDQGTAASAVVDAAGPGLTGPLVERLNTTERQSAQRPLTQLMCAHAARLAPELAPYVGQGTSLATAVLLKVLGHAGEGYEEVIAGQLSHSDEVVVREALRALARIGTDAAASAVCALVRHGNTKMQGPAEEALWRFPSALAHTQLLDLLRQRDFVLSRPKSAIRLLDRAGRDPDHGLEPALADLVSLRFRFWNPSVRRVGTKAQALLRKA